VGENAKVFEIKRSAEAAPSHFALRDRSMNKQWLGTAPQRKSNSQGDGADIVLEANLQTDRRQLADAAQS
jgi:hypothetical protein